MEAELTALLDEALVLMPLGTAKRARWVERAVEARRRVRARQAIPPPQGKPLLFLDIDGVLNDHARHPNRYSGIQADKVLLLNRILEALPELHIVLSSAWRYSFGSDFLAQQILCVFGVDAFERVHGVTALDPIPDERPSYDDVEWWSGMGLRWRAEQIAAYVEAHQPSRYAVLDDLALGCPHLFLTDPDIGLTEEIAAAVVEHFQVERTGADALRDAADADRVYQAQEDAWDRPGDPDDYPEVCRECGAEDVPCHPACTRRKAAGE